MPWNERSVLGQSSKRDIDERIQELVGEALQSHLEARHYGMEPPTLSDASLAVKLETDMMPLGIITPETASTDFSNLVSALGNLSEALEYLQTTLTKFRNSERSNFNDVMAGDPGRYVPES